MCGFAGMYDPSMDAPVPERDILIRMRDVLAHRGPDDCGEYLDTGIGLGFRRLSIIDLEGGHQPMFNEDGAVCVVFNGEIYNHGELRESLIKSGHWFATRCDAEVIVHLYEEKGAGCVEDLRGMFAFAVYDRRQHRLLLARDRLGIKPLFYAREGERLIFGSEPKSLLQAMSSGHTRVDPETASLYFALHYIPDSHCAIAGMDKLPPAHTLEAGLGTMAITRYWQPEGHARKWMNPEEARHGIRDLLEESVRLRMMADVPLGAFLSGGLDSAAVVGIMSRLSDQPVKTFTIGFREEKWDESAGARATAEFHGTQHHELVATPAAADLIHEIVAGFDEPFGDSSAIPTYLVSRLAREHVTVVMSGDGGDELFAGYHRYRKLADIQRLRRLPAGLRYLLLRAGSLGGAHKWADTLHRTMGRTFLSFPDDYFSGESFLAGQMTMILRPLLDSLGPHKQEEAARDLYREHARGGDHISAAQLIDLEVYLPGDILTKVDRATMSCSLEARVPLLDHKLVEAAVALPVDMKLAHGKGKWILREACQDLYPPELLKRRKQGFGVPLCEWFRGPLRDVLSDTLLGQRCRARGFYEHRPLEELIQQHLSGRRDRSVMLYGLLMFELWAQSGTAVGAS